MLKRLLVIALLAATYGGLSPMAEAKPAAEAPVRRNVSDATFAACVEAILNKRGYAVTRDEVVNAKMSKRDGDTPDVKFEMVLLVTPASGKPVVVKAEYLRKPLTDAALRQALASDRDAEIGAFLAPEGDLGDRFVLLHALKQEAGQELVSFSDFAREREEARPLKALQSAWRKTLRVHVAPLVPEAGD